MKLEQEIQQSKFINEYQKAAINITFTHYWLLDHIKGYLKPFDISLQQFNILRILRGQFPKPATINLLKDRMLDKSSDASRLVERLRVKGFVNRNTCTKDRRAVDIVITQKGLQLLKDIDEMDKNFESVFKNLSPGETAELNELLDKIRS